MPYSREEIRASRAEARKLTEALAAGQRPAAQNVPFRLRPGEACYAQGPAQLWQFLEGDGTYIHKSRGGFGLVGLAVVAGTAAGNASRRKRAAREAVARFRPIDQGQLYLTDRRFTMQGQAQWTDLPFDNIRVANCDGSSMIFELSGAPPLRLHVWPVDYYWALFNFLAYSDIITIPSDPELSVPGASAHHQLPGQLRWPNTSLYHDHFAMARC
jgi:hypothetical protein